MSRPSLFRQPDFAKLWTAATISLMGSQVSLIAIPVVAVLILKVPPFEVALLGTFEFLPFIFFTLPAGVWVDRLPRRLILVIGDLGRAVSLATIPIAYAFGFLTIYQLYVVGFVNGILTVFFDVADQAYLPTIVEREDLVDGNAKLQASASVAQVVGQPLGGGVVALLTAPIAVILDALSFLVSAVLIFAIRRIERPSTTRTALSGTAARELTESPAGAASGQAEVAASEGQAEPDQAASVRREIGEGLRFVIGNPYLRNIAASTASSNLFSNILFAIYPVFVYRNLGLTPDIVGLLGGLFGGGALLGAAVAGRVSARFGLGRTIVGSMALGGPAGLGFALATHDSALLLIGAGGFLAGLSNVVYNVNQVSLRQAICPEPMLGRMNATMRFLVWGTIPIGSLIGAGLSEVIGIRPTIWAGALLSFLPVLPVIFSPVRRIQTIPTEEPGAVSAA
jgi:MFS family permease